MNRERRFVSILGDSISTFEGFLPEGYRVFYDEDRAIQHDMTSVYDTWWAKVNQFLHAYLCVNNSYSGSMVSGADFPSAGSDERAALLHTERRPDLILVYMGFNDFGNGIPITKDRQDVPAFFEGYARMLTKVKRNEPQSRILCGTLMETKIRGNGQWSFPNKWAGISLCEYNAAIKIAAELAGAEVADLAAQNLRYETLDGTHPTRAGHATIAQAWINCLGSREALIQSQEWAARDFVPD